MKFTKFDIMMLIGFLAGCFEYSWTPFWIMLVLNIFIKSTEMAEEKLGKKPDSIK